MKSCNLSDTLFRREVKEQNDINSQPFQTKYLYDIMFYENLKRNNNLYKTETLWKRTSPYSFLTLLRALKTSIYFL